MGATKASCRLWPHFAASTFLEAPRDCEYTDTAAISLALQQPKRTTAKLMKAVRPLIPQPIHRIASVALRIVRYIVLWEGVWLRAEGERKKTGRKGQKRDFLSFSFFLFFLFCFWSVARCFLACFIGFSMAARGGTCARRAVPLVRIVLVLRANSIQALYTRIVT